jgi:heat shock protein HtpX
MATLYTHQSENIHKTWILMTLFFLTVIGIGYVFSYVLGNPVILYIAVFLSVFMNIFSYWFSDKLVLSMAGAKPIEKSEAPELYTIVENLSITAGLPMPKIYIIEDVSPNAFATGRDKDHAVVAVTTGILEILNKNELEGVIAHELSHIGNRDMLVSTVVVVLVGFVTLLSEFFLRISLSGSDRRDRGNQIGLFFVIAGYLLAFLSPVIATLIQLAISRKREFLADDSGALLTRYPEGLASALEKISKYSQPMIHANNATAHLYIANPFGPDGVVKSRISRLFMTHPPIEERIKILREM